jgi:hypothetical protein
MTSPVGSRVRASRGLGMSWRGLMGFGLCVAVPEMDALHATAWPLFQLLIVQGVRFSVPPPANSDEELRSSSSDDSVITATLGRASSESLQGPEAAAQLHLRHECFTLIVEQLRMCSEVLMGRRGEDGGVCGAEPVKVEAISFRYLLLLSPLVQHLGDALDSQPWYLPCLFALLVCGSPRIQRLVLRMLRTTLERSPPQVIDEALTAFFKCTERQSLVSWILDRMSLALGNSAGRDP